MLAKRLLLVSIVFMLLSPACSAQAPAQSAVSPSQADAGYFPLKRGAYWIYQGTVKWTKSNSSDAAEQEITWKMEVERVVQRNDIVGYEMLGAPWDLAWYDPTKEPTRYGILQMGSKFYKVPGETVARLSNEGDNLSNLVNEGSLILDTPLEAGKKFGDPAFLNRSDNMYCWVVGEGRSFDASGIKGMDSSHKLQEYPVTIRTNPDASTMYFVPGVGITGYSYIHHGTVSEVDVHLIEYQPGD